MEVTDWEKYTGETIRPFSNGKLSWAGSMMKDWLAILLDSCQKKPFLLAGSAIERKALIIVHTDQDPPLRDETNGRGPFAMSGYMGLYIRNPSVIVLFKKAIKQVARVLKTPPAYLRHVVLLNQAAHWIAHTWPIAEVGAWPEESWQAFEKTWIADIAQITTYSILAQYYDPDIPELKITPELFMELEQHLQSIPKLCEEDQVEPGEGAWRIDGTWFMSLPVLLKLMRQRGLKPVRSIKTFGAIRIGEDTSEEIVSVELLDQNPSSELSTSRA